MHDVLVAAAFMAMVLCPCILAFRIGVEEDEAGT